MELCSIASGSSGNCIYAGTESSHLIEAGLNSIGLKTAEMQALLVTHEHSDHISGLGVVARKYGIPIYATAETIEAVKGISSVGKVDETLFHPIEAGVEFQIGDITVEPVSISHDAANPVAYIMKQSDKKMAVITDLGKYDNYLIDKLQDLDVLLLEANHDVRMLQVGSYPYPLKQRILGDRGHLSNESSGQFLGQLLHDKFKKVVLGHLSKENNLAELAYETVRQEVEQGENPYHGNDFPIQVAKRDEVSELIRI